VLRYWIMHSLSKMVALFAAILVASNAQCVITCAFEQCRPKAPSTRCHHKSSPDRGQPASPACSHNISIVDTGAKTIRIVPAQVFVATANAPLVAEVPQLYFRTRVEAEISPPAPGISSISVLRI
jgi:hypothetical protein